MKTTENRLQTSSIIVGMIMWCMGALLSPAMGQGVFCHPNGNVAIFSNFDGGQLTIDVDSNIANLKIGILTAEAVSVTITGAYASNVTEVIYAGLNGSNFNCSGSPSSTSISGVASSIVTQHTPPSLAAAPFIDANGNNNMVCAFQCDTGNQSGCNTPEQTVQYFLGEFGGDLLFHFTQQSCWNTSSYHISEGGNCCLGAPAFMPFDLGPDTSLCDGVALVLNADFVGSDSYLWSTGDTTSSITVTVPGNYSVTATTGAWVYSDSVSVDYDLVALALPDSVSICPGDSVTLNAKHPGSTYAWNNGSTDSIITVDTAGLQIVGVTVGTCTEYDSTFVTLYQPPTANLGADTAFCENEQLTLSPSSEPSHGYFWSTGSSGNSVQVLSSGLYQVTVTDTNNCSSSDSTFVEVLPVFPPELGPDTAFCEGDLLVLDAGEGSSYAWSDGSNQQNLAIQNGGMYVVTVTDSNGCATTDSIQTTLFPSPYIDLGNDYFSLNPGEQLTFSIPAFFETYLWQWDGQVNTTPSITVTVPFYDISVLASVTDSNGCSASDEVFLSVANMASGTVELVHEEGLELYPNPFRDQLMVQQMTEGITWNLHDSQGRLVHVGKRIPAGSGQATIDLPNLSPGLYLFSWTTGQQSGTQRLVRQE